MKKRVPLTLITFAFMLACSAAFAEESPRSHDGHRGHASMMGCAMMGRGGMMSGSGMMRQGAAMRIIFALMDGDGDGTVSLQEFQPLTKKSSHAVAFVLDRDRHRNRCCRFAGVARGSDKIPR